MRAMIEQQPHWIWQQPDWPVFTWQDQRLARLLREIGPLQGRLLGGVQSVAGEESLHLAATSPSHSEHATKQSR
jgi:hypothetical protein